MPHVSDADTSPNDPATMRAAIADPANPGVVEVRDVARPRPPAPGWVLVRPLLSGVDTRDLHAIESATRAPFVPGHEAVGVVEMAHRPRWATEGTRVVVESPLRCRHKGLPECPACREGDVHLCSNADRDGAIASGSALGSSATAGGTWSDAFVVHEEMLVAAGDIPDHRAVLGEAAAAALHAAFRWDGRGDSAVVIGAGPVSRLTVAALARRSPHMDITYVFDARTAPRRRRDRRQRSTPAHFTLDFAATETQLQDLGATRVWRGSPAGVIDQAASLYRARCLRDGDQPLPLLDRGADVVVDCRGTAHSISTALRLVKPNGTVVLLHEPQAGIDWSLVWRRELRIAGSVGHGREPSGTRSLAMALEWLQDPRWRPEQLVTHRFPLERIDSALATARSGAAMGALKVVLEGPGTGFRTESSSAASDGAEQPVLLAAAAARAARVREAAEA